MGKNGPRLYISILILVFSLSARQAYSQSYSVILGKPTNRSITASIIFSGEMDCFVQYGTNSGNYPFQTPNFNAPANQPVDVDINNLTAGTKYYYRIRYKEKSSNLDFASTPEYTFQTQRAAGQTFSFAVEADPHLDSNSNYEAYKTTLQHMLSLHPDFMIDLGDNFMNDKQPVINESVVTQRNILFRDYFGIPGHSVPLFITIGNHEGELGWLPNTGTSSLPTMAANIRKTYYPNPSPNDFYSGNTIVSANVGLREDYYAWEWGNALFIVIDPYFYTKAKPGWGWTLGKDQYEWLKNVLRNSKAKFKFVFSHQLVGGNGNDGRGGTEFVHLYEMGGRNTDSTWGFDVNRPGWEKPIHQLFVETKVNVFFHGHDHFFGKQEKDGVIYQEVPQPSARNISNDIWTPYGYKEGIFIPSRGYMLVTVSEDSVKLDYIRNYLPSEETAIKKNGDVAFSYSIKNVNSGTQPAPDNVMKVYPNPANSTLNIDLADKPANADIRLINAAGAIILKTKEREINTSQLPSGLYTVQVKTDHYITSRKVIISH